MAKIRELISKLGGKGKLWKVGGLILLLAIGFGGYKYFYTNNQVTYLTSLAEKGTITDAIEATGTLEAVRSVGLSFKSVETITVLNVKAGDRVEEGQVLAEQDTKELSAAVSQAERAVTRQEASIKSLTLTNDKAYKTLQQQESLAEVGAASQSDLDDARDDYERCQLDLITANAQIQDNRASLETARENLAATKITAPFSGIVSTVSGDVGQRSGGGSGSDVNAFITLISDELQIKALVNEVDMGRLKVGQDVEFTVSAYSEKTFTGKVARISPTATTSSNVQFYETLITVDDPDQLLYPGMSATVNIIVSRKSDVVKVSMTALTYAESYQKSNPATAAPGGAATAPAAAQTTTAGTSDSTSRKALVVLEEGNPVLKSVLIGLDDGQDMEVIEGINQGDMVVIGTNQVSTSTSSTTSTSTNTQSKQQSQQGGGPGGGGPGGPPMF